MFMIIFWIQQNDQIRKNAKREIIEYKLSQYACYLIIQNADPNKSLKELEMEKKPLENNEKKKLEEIK